MGTRTVRLDQDSEAALAELRRRTGQSISAVVREGLRAYAWELDDDITRRPGDLYASLGLPREGERSVAPAAQLVTTIPVLTKALHLLLPAGHRVSGLVDFIQAGGVGLLTQDEQDVRRCFDLMNQYADRPMNLADASIVAAVTTDCLGGPLGWYRLLAASAILAAHAPAL